MAHFPQTTESRIRRLENALATTSAVLDRLEKLKREYVRAREMIWLKDGEELWEELCRVQGWDKDPMDVLLDGVVDKDKEVIKEVLNSLEEEEDKEEEDEEEFRLR